MPSGKLHARARKLGRGRRLCAATLVLAATVGGGQGTQAQPQAQAQTPAQAPAQDQANGDKRPVSVTPTLGLEEIFTDNAEVVQRDRKADVLTRALLDVQAEVNGARTTAQLSAQLSYDAYARDSRLDGFSVTANGTASFAVVPGVLSLDAVGTIVNGQTSTFGYSAVDRTGIRDRAQIISYQVGPRLTAPLGDVADLTASAQFAQVRYAAADASVIDTPAPANDSIGELAARIDTGRRLGDRQFVTIGRFEQDDQGFRSASALQSGYFPLSPRVRLVARGGFDDVFQAGAVDLNTPLVTGGLEYTLNPASQIVVEAGRRYDRFNLAATAQVALGARLFLVARYTETIQPDQVTVADALQDYVLQAETLPTRLSPGRFVPTGDIYRQTSFNKVASSTLAYDREDQTFSVSSYYIDREFLPSRLRDRVLTGSAAYRRQIRPDLAFRVQADYGRTFASPVYGPSRTYSVRGQFDRKINSTTDFDATYAYIDSRQSGAGGLAVHENTFLITIRKRV